MDSTSHCSSDLDGEKTPMPSHLLVIDSNQTDDVPGKIARPLNSTNNN